MMNIHLFFKLTQLIIYKFIDKVKPFRVERA